MERSFLANLRELPQIFLWIEEVAAGCSLSCIRKLKLVVEEAVVNIVRHSQSDKIRIAIRKTGNQMEVVIQDQGPPFNPLEEVPDADRISSLETRKEGGLGIFLMKEFSHSIHYRREKEINVLTFTILESSRKK